MSEIALKNIEFTTKNRNGLSIKFWNCSKPA